MSWSEILTSLLLLAGAAFVLIAALGLVRMPDFFLRMQAATKGVTLGISLIVTAVAVHFAEVGTALTAVLIIAFFFLTAPVAAHMIGRAAYHAGVPLWEKTRVDELARADADADADGGGEPSRAL